MKMLVSRSVAVLFLLSLLWNAPLRGEVTAGKRPNVLMVFIDDLRPMTRDYGHEQMQTPNFDRLAQQGLRFESAYCQVPTCGASRASLMTSIYPTVDRFPDFLTWAERDAEGRPTLPQRFREAGYTTLSNGKIFHHKSDTENRSWSEPAWRPKSSGRTYYNESTAEYMRTQTEVHRPRGGKPRKKVPMFEPGLVDPMETHDGEIAQKTMDDLERLADSDAPFFIACGFAKPHMPFYAPAAAWEPYPLESIEIAEHRTLPQPVPKNFRQVREQFAYTLMTPDLDRKLVYNDPLFHKHMRQGYYACVTHADNLLGRILDKLKQLGLDDNTYVIVLGDHGFLLGEHNEWAKNQLLHNALRTAMWMSGPGIAKNAAVGTHVEFVDIYPTLCELASIEIETDAVNGRSFAKLLQDPAVEHRDHAYTRFGNGDAVTTDDYFYVLWQPKQGPEEALLIDRKSDPQGVRNLSGQAEYASIERALREQLLDKIAQAEQIKTPRTKRPQTSRAAADSPQIANRPLTVEATIQSPKPAGVVLSQGGVRFGYSLYFVDGRPVFCWRNNGELTELRGGEVVSGKATVTALVDSKTMELRIDGRSVASRKSPGLLTKQPAAAFSVAHDAGDPVGDYVGPNRFNGQVLSHRIEAPRHPGATD